MTEQEKQDNRRNDWMWRIGMYDCALINYAFALRENPPIKQERTPSCDCKICEFRGYKI